MKRSVPDIAEESASKLSLKELNHAHEEVKRLKQNLKADKSSLKKTIEKLKELKARGIKIPSNLLSLYNQIDSVETRKMESFREMDPEYFCRSTYAYLDEKLDVLYSRLSEEKRRYSEDSLHNYELLRDKDEYLSRNRDNINRLRREINEKEKKIKSNVDKLKSKDIRKGPSAHIGE